MYLSWFGLLFSINNVSYHNDTLSATCVNKVLDDRMTKWWLRKDMKESNSGLFLRISDRLRKSMKYLRIAYLLVEVWKLILNTKQESSPFTMMFWTTIIVTLIPAVCDFIQVITEHFLHFHWIFISYCSSFPTLGGKIDLNILVL